MANVKQFKKGSDVWLSKNFHLSEFDCNCTFPECQWTYVDMDHVAFIQQKRDEWQKPIHIDSGFRCPRWNKLNGGATGSRHLVSDATDIRVDGMTPDEVHADLDKAGAHGLGRYDNFTHVDSRPVGYPARWDFTTKS